MAKIIPLSIQEQAATGFTHVAKITFADLPATATTLTLMAVPTNCYIARMVSFVRTTWTIAITCDIGIAASAASGTTFGNAAVLGTAPVTAALTGNIANATAARFITVTRDDGLGAATAGEFWLYFHLVDTGNIPSATLAAG